MAQQIITPPYSTDLEKDVLSVMCNRPELIVHVEDILYPECFYNSDYQYLFQTVIAIHFAGKEISQSEILHTVVASGKKDILGTYQAMKRYFTSDTAFWRNAMMLSDLAVKRALLRKSLEIQAMIKADDSIDKLDGLINETAEIMTTRNRPVEGGSFSQSLDEMEVLMERDLKKGLSGIETGVTYINEFTSGWEKDDLIVIAARPGMGKTMSAIFHTYHAALSGIPVAFVSLEMTKAKLTSRIVSNVCSISASDITKGRLAHNQKKIIYEKRKEIESLPIYYYENKNSWDINDIVLVMRNWKRKYGIGLMVFDYIQLAKDRTVRDSSDKTRVVTSVQEKLTHLKSTLGVPIIELAQLSRANETRGGDKRPGLSDLKNSGQIEQDASIVIFLFRQDYYDANVAKENGETFIPTNDLEYIFAKNRGGEMNSLCLKADMALNKIWSPDEYPSKSTPFTRF